MNNKSLKIYLVGFVVWLVLLAAAVIVFRYTAFVKESTMIATDEGESITEQLQPISVIVLKQINTELKTHREGCCSWLESDDWLSVTGTDDGSEPTITVPGGLNEYVSWQTCGDTLTITADFSQVESPLVLFSGGKSLEVRVPENMLRKIECETPLTAVRNLTLKGYFSNLELCSGPDLLFDDVRIDTVTVRSRSNRSDAGKKFAGFSCLSDKAMGIECNGSIIGSLNLVGVDSIDNKFDVSMYVESQGRGANKRYIGSIGRLYVASEGMADSTYVKLDYTGSLPEEILFQGGIRNKVDINTSNSYTVATTGKVSDDETEDFYEVYY